MTEIRLFAYFKRPVLTPYLSRIIRLLDGHPDYCLTAKLGKKHVTLPYGEDCIAISIMHNIVFEWVQQREWKIIEANDSASPHRMSCKHMVPILDCVKIFKMQYNPQFLKNYTKISPFAFYPPFNAGLIEQMKESAREIPLTEKNPEMSWRGAWRPQRKAILRKLQHHGTLKEHGDKVSVRDYYKEIASHRVIISLPGFGDRCHREVEAFGLGTPVLMPECRNTLGCELIPNVHYISIPRNCYSAESIIDYYFKHIEDFEFLEYIRRQALRWYEANCTPHMGAIRMLQAMEIFPPEPYDVKNKLFRLCS